MTKSRQRKVNRKVRRGLSWQAAIYGLKNRQPVRFIRKYRHPGALDNEPTIPKGATGVVHENALELPWDARLLSIEPDDKGLRAELIYGNHGLVFLYPPHGSDDDPYDGWDKEMPIVPALRRRRKKAA